MPELACGLLFFLHRRKIHMPELACGLLVLLHGGRSHMVGEAQSWGVIILEERLFLVLLPSLLRSRERVHIGGITRGDSFKGSQKPFLCSPLVDCILLTSY